MPSLKAILKPNQTLSIPFGSEAVLVTYNPQYLTPAFEETLKALGEESKATQAFISMFQKLIISWDLKANDNDPESIPLTLEGFADVPFDILGEILRKVQEEVVPNPQKGETFDDGSLLAASSDQSLPGIP
jgi:hypothetical protein